MYKNKIKIVFIFSENINSISEYLPKSIDELLDLNIDLPDYPRFEPSVSKGLQNTDKNSLLPVFIIPGLGLSRIQSLIDKIMHPVFCAEFPSYSVTSVENAALSLLWVTRHAAGISRFVFNLYIVVHN